MDILAKWIKNKSFSLITISNGGIIAHYAHRGDIITY